MSFLHRASRHSRSSPSITSHFGLTTSPSSPGAFLGPNADKANLTGVTIQDKRGARQANIPPAHQSAENSAQQLVAELPPDRVRRRAGCRLNGPLDAVGFAASRAARFLRLLTQPLWPAFGGEHFLGRLPIRRACRTSSRPRSAAPTAPAV